MTPPSLDQVWPNFRESERCGEVLIVWHGDGTNRQYDTGPSRLACSVMIAQGEKLIARGVVGAREDSWHARAVRHGRPESIVERSGSGNIIYEDAKAMLLEMFAELGLQLSGRRRENVTPPLEEQLPDPRESEHHGEMRIEWYGDSETRRYEEIGERIVCWVRVWNGKDYWARGGIAVTEGRWRARLVKHGVWHIITERSGGGEMAYEEAKLILMGMLSEAGIGPG